MQAATPAAFWLTRPTDLSPTYELTHRQSSAAIAASRQQAVRARSPGPLQPLATTHAHVEHGVHGARHPAPRSHAVAARGLGVVPAGHPLAAACMAPRLKKASAWPWPRRAGTSGWPCLVLLGPLAMLMPEAQRELRPGVALGRRQAERRLKCTHPQARRADGRRQHAHLQ